MNSPFNKNIAKVNNKVIKYRSADNKPKQSAVKLSL